MGHVGESVRRLREEREWTQPRLAVEAGVAVSAVSQIENGKRNPTASTLAKLAGALGVEVADLFPKASTPPLPFDEFGDGGGSEQRRVLNSLAVFKALAERLARRVEALLTDVVERGEELPEEGVGARVGELFRHYCDLDDEITPQLPEYLNDLSVPQAEYELAEETWIELSHIGAMFERIHDKLAEPQELEEASVATPQSVAAPQEEGDADVIPIEELRRRREYREAQRDPLSARAPKEANA